MTELSAKLSVSMILILSFCWIALVCTVDRTFVPKVLLQTSPPLGRFDEDEIHGNFDSDQKPTLRPSRQKNHLANGEKTFTPTTLKNHLTETDLTPTISDDAEAVDSFENNLRSSPSPALSTIPCSDDTTKFVDDTKCVPKSCQKRKHFISEKQLLADEQGFTFLATFPGSGNTWTRAVIQEGTRVWTSSVHHDKSLYDEGYLGEYDDNLKSPFPTVSAIKAHYPYYKKIPYTKTAAVVEVIRAPFDALMAEFQRVTALQEFRKHPNTVDPHVSEASPEALHQQFPVWINKASKKWRSMQISG
jgi:hypothetical protein